MQIYTPQGEIDTKDIEFIAIKKTESDCLEYAIFARVEGKDYELEYTKTNDFKKTVRNCLPILFFFFFFFIQYSCSLFIF